jgi:hypothetical protein
MLSDPGFKTTPIWNVSPFVAVAVALSKDKEAASTEKTKGVNPRNIKIAKIVFFIMSIALLIHP